MHVTVVSDASVSGPSDKIFPRATYSASIKISDGINLHLHRVSGMVPGSMHACVDYAEMFSIWKGVILAKYLGADCCTVMTDSMSAIRAMNFGTRRENLPSTIAKAIRKDGPLSVIVMKASREEVLSEHIEANKIRRNAVVI